MSQTQPQTGAETMVDRNWALNGSTRIFSHPEKGTFYVRDHIANWRLFFADQYTRMFFASEGSDCCRPLADYTGDTIDVAILCQRLGWVGPMGLITYPWDTLELCR